MLRARLRAAWIWLRARNESSVHAMPASPSRDVLARLKHETRREHEAIETALDLMGDALTHAGYRRTLARLHGFYRPAEAQLRAMAQARLDMHERWKTPLLEADLVALGDHAAVLPSCTELLPLASAADGWGRLYVLEGATLGGCVISRHVCTTLGITPDRGGRFFHGYGDRTGSMWRAFQAALAAFATTTALQDRVVASALATFRALRRWYQAGSDP
jgi:heme oxygenase